MRRKKDGLVPVRQHGRVVGFMKESAVKEMSKPYVKPTVDEAFKVKVASLKMRPIR
jgi:hypothetical protein